ncbi:hypothetical protein C8R44DRAFT_889812 [Mycena epipterygia]|nr:hypothetical protein C8R44DRAFT_889812 [Mycena epipterygia]
MISPGHLALVTGLVSSSYFAFGNIGAAYFGIMPATARGKTTLPVQERLALWKYSYEVAKLHMGTSTSVTTVALSTAAYFLPSARPLLIAGAVAASSIGGFTLLFMFPVNNGLSSMLQSTSLKPVDPIQEKHALDQLDKWRAMHRVRIVLGTIAWATAITAILGTDSLF